LKQAIRAAMMKPTDLKKHLRYRMKIFSQGFLKVKAVPKLRLLGQMCKPGAAVRPPSSVYGFSVFVTMVKLSEPEEFEFSTEVAVIVTEAGFGTVFGAV
jgi:hypothetical protein